MTQQRPTMTVQQLIEHLSKYPAETEVMIASPAHDFAELTQALPIEDLERRHVVWSDTHTEFVLPRGRDMDPADEQQDERKLVLLLS